MGTTSRFGALVLFVVIGFLVAVGPAALADGATPEAVTDEPLTVDYSAPSQVAETGISYNGTVTITNGGTALEAGEDYDWNATTGTVEWYNTSATTEGDVVDIDYTVYDTTEGTDGLADMSRIWLIPLALIAAAILGLAALRAVRG